MPQLLPSLLGFGCGKNVMASLGLMALTGIRYEHKCRQQQTIGIVLYSVARVRDQVIITEAGSCGLFTKHFR